MDISLDDSMKSEGIARELISRVQKLRKKAGLVPTDEIDVYLTAENRDSDLQKIIVAYKEFIGNSLKVKLFIEEPKQSLTMIIQDVQKVSK